MPNHLTVAGIAVEHVGEARRLIEAQVLALQSLLTEEGVRHNRRLSMLVDHRLSDEKKALVACQRGYAAAWVVQHDEDTHMQEKRNGTIRGGEFNGSPTWELLNKRKKVLAFIDEIGNPDGLSLSHLRSEPDTLDTNILESGRLRLEQVSAA